MRTRIRTNAKTTHSLDAPAFHNIITQHIVNCEYNCLAIYALGVEASTPSAPWAGPCMIEGFVKD